MKQRYRSVIGVIAFTGVLIVMAERAPLIAAPPSPNRRQPQHGAIPQTPASRTLLGFPYTITENTAFVGPPPKITSIEPVDPDDRRPFLESGQTFTIHGSQFAASADSNWILLGPVVSPAQVNPIVSAVAVVHPASVVHPFDRGWFVPSALKATAPESLPGGSGLYSLWVVTRAGGYSHAMDVRYHQPEARDTTPPHFGPAQVDSFRALMLKPDIYPACVVNAYGKGLNPQIRAWLMAPAGAIRLEGYPNDTHTQMLLRLPHSPAGVYNVMFEADDQDTAYAPIMIQNPQPMNLYWESQDPNGFPLNPMWGYQLLRQPSDPDYIPQYDTPNKIGALCSVHLSADYKIIPGLFPLVCGGVHLNYFPVTYTGRVRWHQKCSDDDYNVALFPPESAGSTDNSGLIMVEFDSDETVDQFTDGEPPAPWWKEFRAAVDTDRMMGTQLANNAIDYRDAVVTGLFGLDCVHDCESELHPAWAFFVNVDPKPRDDEWAFFVRNAGNEGECSTLMHYLEGPLVPAGQHQTVCIRLPWKNGYSGVTLLAADVRTTAECPVTFDYWWAVPGEAITLAFTLPENWKEPWMAGTIRFQWEGTAVQPYALRVLPNVNHWSEEEVNVAQMVSRAPEAERLELARVLRSGQYKEKVARRDIVSGARLPARVDRLPETAKAGGSAGTSSVANVRRQREQKRLMDILVKYGAVRPSERDSITRAEEGGMGR